MKLNLPKYKGRCVKSPPRDLIAKYRLPLYENFHLWLVVADDLPKTFHQIFPDDDEKNIGRCDGLTIYRPSAVFILLKRSRLSHNTLVHELVHACHYFCDMMKIKVCADDHEPYAYMMGHLAGVCEAKIRRWKLKIC